MKRGVILLNSEDLEILRTIASKLAKLTSSKIIYYNDRDFLDIYKEIRSLREEYDFLLTWCDSNILDNMKPIHEIGLPYIMETGDCWGRLFSKEFRNIIDYHKPDVLMVGNKCTIPPYREYLNDDDMKFIWSPESMNPDIMKDWGEKKTHDITFSGKFSNYNDRRLMHLHLTRANDVGKLTYIRYERVPSTIDYAKNLNRGWMSFSSLQNDAFIYYNHNFIGNCFVKNIEIPACKSCLITRRFGDADELGFNDEENCLLFDEIREFPKKIRGFLDDRESLGEIIQKGYDMVHEKHTVDVRVKELADDIDKIL